MSLNLYVGSLTRYYAAQWQRALLDSEQGRRQPGPIFPVPSQPGNLVTDPSEIEPAVVTWRADLNQRLSPHISVALDWQEGMSPPHFSDAIGAAGYAGLILWAAYLEKPDFARPTEFVPRVAKHPAIDACLEAGSAAPIFSIINSELWLPGHFRCGVEFQEPSGGRLRICSIDSLLTAMNELNARAWNADRQQIVSWRWRGLNDKGGFEEQAQFGFAVAHIMASLAVRYWLPMKLHY